MRSHTGQERARLRLRLRNRRSSPYSPPPVGGDLLKGLEALPRSSPSSGLLSCITPARPDDEATALRPTNTGDSIYFTAPPNTPRIPYPYPSYPLDTEPQSPQEELATTDFQKDLHRRHPTPGPSKRSYSVRDSTSPPLKRHRQGSDDASGEAIRRPTTASITSVSHDLSTSGSLIPRPASAFATTPGTISDTYGRENSFTTPQVSSVLRTPTAPRASSTFTVPSSPIPVGQIQDIPSEDAPNTPGIGTDVFRGNELKGIFPRFIGHPELQTVIDTPSPVNAADHRLIMDSGNHLARMSSIPSVIMRDVEDEGDHSDTTAVPSVSADTEISDLHTALAHLQAHISLICANLEKIALSMHEERLRSQSAPPPQQSPSVTQTGQSQFQLRVPRQAGGEKLIFEVVFNEM
ncbi:hypothetical protein NLI96_g7386 [Meripilus lineatus]|uniref:Uncharacterized protein n=1 Tax=Meripilus lineatus TaxID=2056292 RepID=A0AAD5V0Z6_9APHY|nr:hypothetical protein NLI96_g7386 [Physisporinus lineatus]